MDECGSQGSCFMTGKKAPWTTKSFASNFNGRDPNRFSFSLDRRCYHVPLTTRKHRSKTAGSVALMNLPITQVTRLVNMHINDMHAHSVIPLIYTQFAAGVQAVSSFERILPKKNSIGKKPAIFRLVTNFGLLHAFSLSEITFLL